MDADMVSELPDAILCEIISLLPFESAITTSMLSRRWQHLWTQLPSLSFYKYNFMYYTYASRFWTKLDTITTKLTSPLSRTLVLDLCYTYFSAQSHCPSFSDSWFRQLCGSNSMEMIQIISNGPRCARGSGYDFVAPSICVFQMQSLQVLELGGCFAWTLPPCHTHIHLPNLKRLRIHVICYQFQLLGKLVSSIPSLEDLCFRVNCGSDRICSFHGTDDDVDDHISLLCPNLKKLYAKIFSNSIRGANKVIVDAPMLQHFKATSYSSKFYFVQKPTLVQEAVIRDNSYDTRTMFDIFEAVSNARKLVVKGITAVVMELGPLLTYPNLSTLGFRVSCSKDVENLLLLLQCCPVLQVLNLDLNAYSVDNTADKRWTPSDFTPGHMLTYVNMIQISISYHLNKDLVNLVKYLLTTTCALEQLKIQFIDDYYFRTAEAWKQADLWFFDQLIECQNNLLQCFIEYHPGFSIKVSCSGSKLIEELSSRAVEDQRNSVLSNISVTVGFPYTEL